MFRELTAIPAGDPLRNIWVLRNGVPEGVLLHTRNLCDFCTSKNPNDIKPSDLFGDYEKKDPEHDELKRLISLLKKEYGANSKGSPKWALNKMLAHPTKERGDSFDYTPYLQRILPLLQGIITEIVRLENLPGRDFPPA